MSARRGGVAPTTVVFVGLAVLFVYLVAYCAFGWIGVAVAWLIVGLIATVLRSEVTRVKRDHQRRDDEYVRYQASRGPAPRRRGRGGAR